MGFQSKIKLFESDVLFVCDSNTVISPFAEAVFNKFSSDKKAFSAGLNGQSGGLASFDAIKMAAVYEVNLFDYETRSISDFNIDDVGLVLTSNTQVKDRLKGQYPDLEIFTIREYAGCRDVNINEPVFGSYAEIENCFRRAYDVILKITEYDFGILDDTKAIACFRDLDYSIRSGFREISLTSDIALGDHEGSDYKLGIKIDANNVVIDGNGHCIDGAGKVRFFEIIRGNVTLKNITFKNGYAPWKGDKYDHTLHQCLITNSFNCSLKIENCNFIGNDAYNDNFIENKGILTVHNSNFRHNKFSRLIVNVGKLDIDACIFENNLGLMIANSIAEPDLKVDYKLGNVKVSGTDFMDNGWILNNSGNFRVVNSKIIKNESLLYNDGELDLIGCRFGDNRDGIENDGRLYIVECEFEHDLSDEGTFINNNGKIKISDSGFFKEKHELDVICNNDYLEINKCVFDDNYGVSIVKNSSKQSELYITLAEFSNNYGAYSTIHNLGETCSISKSRFKDNYSPICNSGDIANDCIMRIDDLDIQNSEKSIFNDSIIRLPTRQDSISYIYNRGKIVIEDEVDETNEYNFTYLDNLIHSGRSNIVLKEDISLNPSEFDFYEGGIELDIDGLQIDGNGKTIRSSGRSRMFLITARNVTLKNIVFEDGHNFESYDNPDCGGGAIQINSTGSLLIEDCRFTGNASKRYGGAIHNYGKTTVKSAEFTGNESNGGAICNNKNAVLDIEGGSFIENSGGAIVNDGTVIMDNAEFRLNESVDWACILNRGFARLEMFGCRFNDNSSKYDAVIKNESQAVLVMDKTSCKHNKSTSLFNQAVMKITDSIFTGNFSAKNTGAIKNSGKLEVYGTKFLDNESERYGGAVSNLYDGIMDVCNSQFMNNRTIEFAGAVANIGKISIKDCIFKNNASQYGGAINNQGKMNIISCEFEDNESEYGGAIYNCKIMNVLASEFKANKSQEKSNSIANGLHKFHPLFDEEKTQLILQLNPYDYLFSHLIIKNTDFFNDYSIDDEVCTWSPRDLRLENCRYNNRELGMENTN